MRSKIVTFFSALTLAILLAAAASLDAQSTHYRVVNLGNLSGTSSSGNTLNNIRWAMGSANLSGNTAEHAKVWVYGIKADLGTLGGPNSDVQWPVKNDKGWSRVGPKPPP